MPAALDYPLEITAPQSLDVAKPYAARIPMTAEQFLAWDHGNRQAEWVDGEAYLYMTTTNVHERILLLLTTLFQGFATIAGQGVARRGPFAMRAMPGGPVREPDLMFFANLRDAEMGEGPFEGPADVIVEVISPDSVRRDRTIKFREYEAAGVREYWLVDPRPRRRELRAYSLGPGGFSEIALVDGILQSRVMPGLWIHDAWLWDPSVNVFDCLDEIFGIDSIRAARRRGADENQ